MASPLDQPVPCKDQQYNPHAAPYVPLKLDTYTYNPHAAPYLLVRLDAKKQDAGTHSAAEDASTTKPATVLSLKATERTDSDRKEYAAKASFARQGLKLGQQGATTGAHSQKAALKSKDPPDVNLPGVLQAGSISSNKKVCRAASAFVMVGVLDRSLPWAFCQTLDGGHCCP